jgi:glycosyltransferase involved in cell wall biosynthesis
VPGIQDLKNIPPNCPQALGDGTDLRDGYRKAERRPGSRPLVSVITVVLNAAGPLEKTILSVLNQDCRDLEYIIVDGGSTDGTLQVIERFQEKIDYWVSEPDGGIADAFNKGILSSSGKWINFLNAGDVFMEADSVITTIEIAQDYPIVTGFALNGKRTIPRKILRNKDPLPVKSMISHQASFVDRAVFEDIGLFSTQFLMRMDYDFWLRALVKYRFKFIDKVLVDYDAGFSRSDLVRFYQEEVRANNENLTCPNYYNIKALLKMMIKYFLFKK